MCPKHTHPHPLNPASICIMQSDWLLYFMTCYTRLLHLEQWPISHQITYFLNVGSYQDIKMIIRAHRLICRWLNDQADKRKCADDPSSSSLCSYSSYFFAPSKPERWRRPACWSSDISEHPEWLHADFRLVVVGGFFAMCQEGVHAFISPQEAVHAHDGIERQNPVTETSQNGDIIRKWKLRSSEWCEFNLNLSQMYFFTKHFFSL